MKQVGVNSCALEEFGNCGCSRKPKALGAGECLGVCLLQHIKLVKDVRGNCRSLVPES